MYLKGINSLRFFAAMLVVIYHCNDGLRTASPELVYDLAIFKKGAFAVDLFFVISGFLLTYLALSEIQKKGFLNIRRFFYRRILRIFPLYYLGVFLGFFLLGVIYPILMGSVYFDFRISEVLWYYLGFLPNYPIVRWENIGPMYSLWSIGVEEQFYLFFPMIMILMTKWRRDLLLAISLFSVYLFFYLSVFYHQVVMPFWLQEMIILTLRFHYLFMGMVFGVAFFFNKDHSFFRFIGHKVIQLIIYLSFVAHLFLVSSNHPVSNLFSALLFSFILINGVREVSLVNLEQRHLNYLGIISYGIYIFHPYVSLVLRYAMVKWSGLNQWVFAWPLFFHLLVSMVSILVAALSYKYYESYFLRLKVRYK
ncbi:MAG: acyltransferase [Saprospiraceae bacterium]|nr:acyltransferase [Saprospiraceae bacterium]